MNLFFPFQPEHFKRNQLEDKKYIYTYSNFLVLYT